MTTPDSLTGLLARFCADRALHARFPASAIRLAELAIADSVACIIAGIDDPAAVKLGRTIADEAGGPSRRAHSLRHRHAVSAREAAAVNACAGHARELDDNVMPAVIHSSIVLTPALIALGETRGASGLEIVRAFIVGKEVNAQIGRLVNPAHCSLGWNANSSIGVFGAAVACATLMKLDADQAMHALSLAFSMASGTNLQFGTEAKPLHCGLAAEWGIWAAELAAQGYQGYPEVLQGKWSFEDLYAHGQARSTEPFLPPLFPAAPLAIDEYPPVAKLYPCCGSSHLGIDALRALRARHAFALDDIERIDVHMLKQMTENLRYREPADEVQARFSMPYCAAVTLVDGMPQLRHFSPEAFTSPDAAVMRLLPRVHTHVRDPSPEVLAKRLIFLGDCLVELRLKNGQVLREIAEHPKGCADNPLTDEERLGKFIDCAAGHLGEAGARQLHDRLMRLSSLPSIGEIGAVFHPGAPRVPGM